LLLDERETVSYPDGIEAQDARIYIIYDRNRNTDREVWMAVFTERDVLDSTCVSEDCRFGSEAAIDNSVGPMAASARKAAIRLA